MGMDRFDVVVEGFEPDSVGRAPDELARLFGIEVDRARQVVASCPATVKRDVDLETAERFFHALRAAGARVRLDRRAPAAEPGPPEARPGALPAIASAAASEGPTITAVAAGGAYREPAPPTVTTRAPFPPVLLGALAYPLQSNAPPLFLGTAVVAQLAGYLPIVGGLLRGGILLGFFVSVLRASARGEEELPLGGDFTDWDDFMRPIMQYTSAFALAFAPALVLGVWAPSSAPWFWPALAVAMLAGVAYLPAALILAAHSSGCFGMNPVAGFQMIARVPFAYAMTALAVGVVLGGDVLLVAGLQVVFGAIPLPVVPGILTTALGLYMPAVAARMLGLFIHHHEPELGI